MIQLKNSSNAILSDFKFQSIIVKIYILYVKTFFENYFQFDNFFLKLFDNKKIVYENFNDYFNIIIKENVIISFDVFIKSNSLRKTQMRDFNLLFIHRLINDKHIMSIIISSFFCKE